MAMAYIRRTRRRAKESTGETTAEEAKEEEATIPTAIAEIEEEMSTDAARFTAQLVR